MRSNEVCGGCGHGGQCQSVYHRLGHVKGPSVVSKVLVAFGAPILVFIATLAGADLWLGDGRANQTGPALLSFAVALVLTALVVLGIRRIMPKPAGHADASETSRIP